MIPASIVPWFRAWFARDAELRIRGTFGRIYVCGVEHLQSALERGPTLVVSNHTSFWDPLCVLYLTRRILRAEARALMDARNLERLPFFALVGAFGVRRGDPRDTLAALRYAVKALERPNDLVWVFPQGKEVPITHALHFEGGAAHIERLAKGASVVPVALRYEFGGEPTPSLWIAIGEPFGPGNDVKVNQARQEDAVRRQLLAIDDAIAGNVTEFELRHAGRPSLALRLGSAVLSWFARLLLRRHPASSARR